MTQTGSRLDTMAPIAQLPGSFHLSSILVVRLLLLEDDEAPFLSGSSFDDDVDIDVDVDAFVWGNSKLIWYYYFIISWVQTQSQEV